MPGNLRVGCFTLSGLTVVSASGYTGHIGSRERIIPMKEKKQVRAGLLVPLWAVAGVCVVSVGGALAQVAVL